MNHSLVPRGRSEAFRAGPATVALSAKKAPDLRGSP
jgi:hypothetical protein